MQIHPFIFCNLTKHCLRITVTKDYSFDLFLHSLFPLYSYNFCLFVLCQERHEQNDMKVPNTPEFKPVGCFKDRGRKPRPLPEKIANLRRLIDWYNLNKTITECARRVNKRGLHYFGIQFYGECWSGENAERTYNKQGRSTRCLHGVGKGHANFVYAFVEKGTCNRNAQDDITRCLSYLLE